MLRAIAEKWVEALECAGASTETRESVLERTKSAPDVHRTREKERSRAVVKFSESGGPAVGVAKRKGKGTQFAPVESKPPPEKPSLKRSSSRRFR